MGNNDAYFKCNYPGIRLRILQCMQDPQAIAVVIGVLASDNNPITRKHNKDKYPEKYQGAGIVSFVPLLEEAP